MNHRTTLQFRLGIVLGLCLAMAGTAWCQSDLQDAAAPAAGEESPVAVAAEPPAEEPGPAAPETPGSPDETPAPAEPAPVVLPTTPARLPPAFRGADMPDAFKGVTSSRFAAAKRAHKLAGKSLTKEKGEWRREIEIGINTSQGNSDTLRCDATASAARETEETSHLFKAGGRYGENDSEKDTENALAEAKVQWKLTERLYSVAEANLYHDQIADLSYRARGSVALGRHFFRSERTLLSAEAGPGYIAEKKGGVSEGFIAGRVGQYFDFLATPSLQLWEAIEYVPSLEDSRVYFINAEVGLETVLVPNLSLRCVAENRFDSAPAEDKERNDLFLTTSLVWGF